MTGLIYMWFCRLFRLRSAAVNTTAGGRFSGQGPQYAPANISWGRHGVEYLYRMSIYYNVLVTERDNNSIERQRLTGIGHDFVE